MAMKPTTPERKEPMKKYPSRRSIAKLPLSDVIARLLDTGLADLGRRGIYNDEARQDPFVLKPLTLDEEFNRRLACYEFLARHELFASGVQRYVSQLDLATIDKELKTRSLGTTWSNRSDTRTTKEKALVTAIILEEK